MVIRPLGRGAARNVKGIQREIVKEGLETVTETPTQTLYGLGCQDCEGVLGANLRTVSGWLIVGGEIGRT